MKILNVRKIVSALSITLLGLNFFPTATSTTHPAAQAATKVTEQAKTKIIQQTTREIKLPGIKPLPTAYGDARYFHVRHNVTVEPGGPPVNDFVSFSGSVSCQSSEGESIDGQIHYLYLYLTPWQNTHSTSNHNIEQHIEGYFCSYTATAYPPPDGYVWESIESTSTPVLKRYYAEYAIERIEDFAPATPHTYEFNWKLVKKPQVIDPPQLTASDPCGPNNATWQIPPRVTGISGWHVDPQTGSLQALAAPGYAMPTYYDNEFASYHIYGKPQDSNVPCANIQLKMSGGRFPDTDHQFVMSWQQDSPRITNGSTSARTNIQGADPTFSVTSAPVTTSPNATGTIKISTRPRASYSRDYKTEINCYYTSSTGERVDVPAHRTDSATHFWSITMPSTAQQTICEANVIPNFGFVSVDSFNGGYAANLTADVIQQQQPTTGQQNWVLYPEGKTPGTVDLSKPFHGVELSQGVFQFYEHKPGIYYLEQTSTPEGYVPAGVQTTDTANVSKVTINTQGTRKTYFKIKVNPGETHTVPFYLQQKLGNLEFHNTALTSEGPLLEGSTWQLSGTSGGIYQQHNLTDGPLTITDCVAAAANECTGYDTDPAAGKFSIPNLEWGDYTLTQTQASPGYKLPDAHLATRQFTINQNTLQSSFTGANSFVNEYSDIPSIPHTGGLGRDHLLLSGIFVLLLAGAATVLLQRRAKHQ